MLGARGSGQLSSTGRGYGDLVAGFVDELEEALRPSHRRVSEAPIVDPDYPAYGVDQIGVLDLASEHTLIGNKYFEGLARGVGAGLKYVRARVSRCPGEQIVLAGYSQGAMVMHRILHALRGNGDADVLKHIAGVALIADGDRQRDAGTHLIGDPAAGAHGIGIAARFGQHDTLPPAILSRTWAICTKNDLVCDFRLGPIDLAALTLPQRLRILKVLADGGTIHTHYEKKNSSLLRRAARAIAADIRTTPAAPNVDVYGQFGQPVSQQLTTDIDADFGLEWRVAAGEHLPAGFALDRSGLLTGTASADDSFGVVDVEVRGAVLGVKTRWVRGAFQYNFTAAPTDDVAWSRVAGAGSPLSLSSSGTSMSCPTKDDCFSAFASDQRLLIEASHDGGQTWSGVYTEKHFRADFLGGIHCTSASTCLVVTSPSAVDNGELFQTVDGGTTWARQVLTLGSVNTLSCPRESFCYLLGVDPNAFSSTYGDGAFGSTGGGGVLLPSPGRAHALSCPDVGLCYIAQGSDLLLYREDGPSHWTTLTTPFFVQRIGCIDVETCWIVGEIDDVVRVGVSSDGGLHWSTHSVPTSLTASDGQPIECMSAADCRLLLTDRTTGDDVAVRTTNGGLTWDVADLGAPGMRYYGARLSLDCPTVLTCLAGVGGLMVTTDGATTWTPTGADGVSAVACPAPDRCVLAGGARLTAQVSKTSWITTRLKAQPQIGALDCASSTDCLAAGTDSDGGFAVTSGDGGRTWTRAGTPVAGSRVLACATASTCLTVLGDHQVSVTRDGGHSWSTPETLDTWAINAAACPSATLCLLATAAGITRSTDGGRHWSTALDSYAEDITCPTQAFCIALLDDGYAVSTDQGAHWSHDTITVLQPRSVDCASPTYCVTVGYTDDGTPALAASADRASTWRLTAVPQPVTDAWSPSCADGTPVCYVIGSERVPTPSTDAYRLAVPALYAIE